jgi:site-specific recombinase XerD
MLSMLIGCGLRVSGLVGLNDSTLLWYQDAGRERLVVKVTEKGKKERLIPVPGEAAMLLRAYLGHEELQAIPRTLPSGDAVLFVTVNNRTIPACDYYGEARRMTRAAVLAMVKRHGERAQVSASILHPHALRHLYGAELTEDDTPVLTQQALMGHADPKSTAVYAGLAHRKLRATVDKSNPLAKMRAPLLDTLRSLGRAIEPAAHVRSRPAAAQKSKSAKPAMRES